MKRKVSYILTVLVSIILIVVGNKVAVTEGTLFSGDVITHSGKVTEIVSRTEEEITIGSEKVGSSVTVTFLCKVKDGLFSHKEIEAFESIASTDGVIIKEVEVGDRVLITRIPDTEEWFMYDFERLTAVAILGVIFVLLVLLLGGKKGVNTIVSLAFTCLSVFCVFLPAVISGKSIYLWSVLICIYIIVMTMLIINGLNKKSLAAGLGCTLGVFVAGLLFVIMDKIISLTGATSEETIYLSQNGFDIKGIIFAGIIIGAVGAIMDVSESLSSSLLELYRKSENKSMSSLVSSGLLIGRDIMGTMANTLVLAYIGCDLAATLLMVSYSSSFLELMNKESIIVSLLQAITGSLGILLAIPFTTVIAAFLYTRTDMTDEIEQAKAEETALIGKDKYYIEPSQEPSLFEKVDKADD